MLFQEAPDSDGLALSLADTIRVLFREGPDSGDWQAVGQIVSPQRRPDSDVGAFMQLSENRVQPAGGSKRTVAGASA